MSRPRRRPAPAGSEAAVVADIRDWLDDTFGRDAKHFKVHGSIHQESQPDLIFVVAGVPFVMECKRPGEVATPRQERQLEGWKRAGAIVGTVDNLSDLQFLVRRGLIRRLPPDDPALIAVMPAGPRR